MEVEKRRLPTASDVVAREDIVRGGGGSPVSIMFVVCLCFFIRLGSGPRCLRWRDPIATPFLARSAPPRTHMRRRGKSRASLPVFLRRNKGFPRRRRLVVPTQLPCTKHDRENRPPLPPSLRWQVGHVASAPRIDFPPSLRDSHSRRRRYSTVMCGSAQARSRAALSEN